MPDEGVPALDRDLRGLALSAAVTVVCAPSCDGAEAYEERRGIGRRVTAFAVVGALVRTG
ncbi:hypothetical protein GCM10010261_20960 [Streptomyces pilosus]|nr:hypothetical protein GCM10010261_20960 [Streptomyces pilosus]